MNVTLDKQTALRVRLDIRNADLANLPWELMVSTPGKPFPLVISRKFPITRCAYGEDLPAKLELPQPLRMLIVVSSPEDKPEFAAEPILAAINTALAPHVAADSIQLKTVRHVSMAKLEDELGSEYDILHYIGHGQFDHDEGSLLLESPDRHASPVNGREFATLLVDASIRLLVITACDLATASRRDPRLGVADAALRAGVPAVIAMQSQITDTEAAWFSSAFYPALINGEPLEAAWRAVANASLRRRPAGTVRAGQLPSSTATCPMGSCSTVCRAGRPSSSRTNGRILIRAEPADQSWRSSQSDGTANSATATYELDELRTIIDASVDDDPKTPIVISGPPGSGSSSLALETAFADLDLSRREPVSQHAFAGVIRVSRRHPPLSGPLPIQPTMGWGIEELYQQLAEALRIPGLWQARPYEQSDLLRAASRQNRYLVVIDDLDELRGLTLEQLTDRLPAPTTIVGTSHLPVDEATHGVELRQLSAGQAADLLQQAAAGLFGQATAPNRSPAELLESVSVLGSASGNPLALRLLAGRLADGEDVLATAAARAETPSTDQEWLRLLIHESLGRCSTAEMAALQTVALYPETLQAAEVAHALDRPEEESAGFLGHLQQLGLINVTNDKTISLSPRIRHEALDDVDQGEELIRRAIQDTLTTIERNARGSEDQPAPASDPQRSVGCLAGICAARLDVRPAVPERPARRALPAGTLGRRHRTWRTSLRRCRPSR